MLAPCPLSLNWDHSRIMDMGWAHNLCKSGLDPIDCKSVFFKSWQSQSFPVSCHTLKCASWHWSFTYTHMMVVLETQSLLICIVFSNSKLYAILLFKSVHNRETSLALLQRERRALLRAHLARPSKGLVFVAILKAPSTFARERGGHFWALYYKYIART